MWTRCPDWPNTSSTGNIDVHPYVELAVTAIQAYVREGKKIPPPRPLPEGMGIRAAAFVSIKKGGALRGCIGTILPAHPSLAEEIIENAVSSATRDTRFPPVGPDELGTLTVSVDVLSTPEPVASVAELDAKKYGVIAQSGFRRGLLLPDIAGVDTPEEQIAICRRKGGIGPEEEIELQRFTVTRYR